MSIFNLSTGKKAETNGSFEMGGSSEPIPNGTKVKAAITEAGWKEYKDVRYINLRWDVLDGEYKKRVIFQKVYVFGRPDAKTESDRTAQSDKNRKMLSAIDANCGGKLAQIEGEPSDIDIIKALANKPMIIRLGVWELEDKSNSGNWVSAVESNGKAPAPSAKKTETAPAKKEPDPVEDDDASPDIPF